MISRAVLGCKFLCWDANLSIAYCDANLCIVQYWDANLAKRVSPDPLASPSPTGPRAGRRRRRRVQRNLRPSPQQTVTW
jgi:hypothetical protein